MNSNARRVAQYGLTDHLPSRVAPRRAFRRPLQVEGHPQCCCPERARRPCGSERISRARAVECLDDWPEDFDQPPSKRASAEVADRSVGARCGIPHDQRCCSSLALAPFDDPEKSGHHGSVLAGRTRTSMPSSRANLTPSNGMDLGRMGLAFGRRLVSDGQGCLDRGDLLG